MANEVNSSHFEEKKYEQENDDNQNAVSIDIMNRIDAMLDNSLDLNTLNQNRRPNHRDNFKSGMYGLDALNYIQQTPDKMFYRNHFTNMDTPDYSSTPLGSGQTLQRSSSYVNTLNIGDKKYPDVTLPLRKILQQSSESYPSTPSNSTFSDNSSPFRSSRSPPLYDGSPTLEQAILMGCESLRNSQASPQINEQNSSGISHGSDSIASIASLLNNIGLTSHYSENTNPRQDIFRQTSHSSQIGTPLKSSLSSPSNSASPQNLNWGQMRNDLDTSSLLNSSLLADKRFATINSMLQTNYNDPNYVEKAAKLYRSAAAFNDATCTWSGQLPPRQYRNPIYSCKVFLGGVPWDITETGLVEAFAPFGPIRIQWPGKDSKHPTYPPKGYVYILFESERHVKAMLQTCTHDCSSGGNWYFRISSRRMRSKEVQVIPWITSDSNFVRCPSQRLDHAKTVFVGALHGMLNAEGLAHLMNDLFGGVVYAGIDTDKYKYPIGSGRVTFNNHKSYMKAVAAAFVEIKTAKFTKKVQVDPYLEDSLCSACSRQHGPYFCRDVTCFKYYCRSCWQWQHSVDSLKHHKPLMRNTKTSIVSQTGTTS